MSKELIKQSPWGPYTEDRTVRYQREHPDGGHTMFALISGMVGLAIGSALAPIVGSALGALIFYFGAYAAEWLLWGSAEKKRIRELD